MQRFTRYCLLAIVVLAMTLLTISVGRRLVHRVAVRIALDSWDIPELADHLNRAGLKVQLRSPRQDGAILLNGFLTTTHKDWEELNRLGIDPGPSRIGEWRGIVYCERAGRGKLGPPHWEDHSLLAGSFLFYGDIELLERIRTILLQSEPLLAL
jgi:hypothetical protein